VFVIRPVHLRPLRPLGFVILFAAAVVVSAVTLGGAEPPKSASPAAPSPQSHAPKSSPKAAAPAAVPPEQIGIVDGIPILQVEWDRLAKPYFEEIQARAGRSLNDEERKLLQKNVLDELIRERLWLADAQRRGMKVTEAEIDARMKQSDFFKTGGKLDEAKFQAFKHSTSSNYPELRFQAERGLLLEEYVRWMERRFGPREAELKKTFEERTTQASIDYIVLGPDAVSLDPEATPAQVRAYYDAHPDEFMSGEEARIQYIRVSAVSEGAASDSAREAAGRVAMKTAGDLLAAVKAGLLPENAAKPHGGVHESGWFRLNEPVRGLGRSDALVALVRATRPGEWAEEPIRIGPFVVVVRLAERHDTARLPFRDVVTQAKRKADAEVRDASIDSLARAEVRLHPDVYAVPRVSASILARGVDSFDAGRPPSAKDVEKRLGRLRRELKLSGSERAWADSARPGIADLIRRERRLDQAWRTLREAGVRLKDREDRARVAARYAAAVREITLYRGEPLPGPLLVEGNLLDTLYTLRPGDVLGPRVNGDSVFVVRVDALDLGYTPPYEAVRAAARAAATEQRRQRLESEAESYFREHRGDYRTPTRWVIDAVAFRRAKPQDVKVSADSIAAYWRSNPLEFTVPGRAHVRHILVAFRAADGAGAREAARQKALAARKRIADGEEFAAVAREVSEDTGSASKGGDLGELTRGSVAKEFGDVAFTAPVGELSQVFETRFGFHVLEVESRKAERLRPLGECEEEIQGVLGGAVADSSARTGALKLIAAASEPGANFESLAAAYGGAKRSNPVGANEPIEGIGAAPWLEKTVGSLPDGGVAPEPIELPDGYVVVRRVREVPPGPATFEDVKERLMAERQLRRRRAVADSLDARYRAAFLAGASPESLFVGLGGLRVSKQFGREGPIPDLSRDPALARDSTFLSRVFSSEPGTPLPPIRGSMGTLYAVVDTVEVQPPAEFAKHRDTLLRELVDQRVEAWTQRLRAKAPIRIHRKELRAQLG
jgi:parvulin-like peptidyl-prolyl isomerase